MSPIPNVRLLSQRRYPYQQGYSSIGIFDSGLGGLTVIQEIARHLPEEHLIFVGDQEHMPYGERDFDEVRNFGMEISASLIKRGCTAIVMACNTMSAIALESVQTRYPSIPIMGTIHVAAHAAKAVTRNGRIGVLATTATVRSHAYSHALRFLDPRLQILEVACPEFASLIEAGPEHFSTAEQFACEYLAPLLATDVDTVILGCTHYPLLRPRLEAIAGHLQFIDPAPIIAIALKALLASQRRNVTANPQRRHALYTTGDLSRFALHSGSFLPPTTSYEIRQANWKGGILRL